MTQIICQFLQINNYTNHNNNIPQLQQLHTSKLKKKIK